MRAAFTGTVIAWAALGLGACGGSKPNAATPAEEAAEPSASDGSTAPQQPEESWGGDDAAVAKEGDAPAGDAAAPSDSAPQAEAGGAAPPANSGAPETRSTEAIAEVVNQNRQKVRACYEAVQKKLPDLKGDLVITFTLDAEGKVKSAEHNLEKSTLKNADIGKCAVDELKTWKFPPSSRGMDTTVNYPFNFKPKK